MTKILVIEDDPAILKVIQRGLEYEGYLVEIAENGEDGLRKIQKFKPDLIILDWMLPGMDGIEICYRIRPALKTPILMLTARDAVNDRVQGLDAGADDYLVKPFVFDELLARIRALLRRVDTSSEPEVLQFADLELDTGTRRARRGDRVIELTAKEYDLLEWFMRHPRQVMTRDVLFEHIWGYDFQGMSNVLEVYIRYLRQKLEAAGEPRLIHTIRGVGYVLREED